MVRRNKKERAPFPSPTFILATIVCIIVGYGFYRFGHYMVTESDMFKLKSIQVVGNKYIEKKEILKLADLKTGIRLFQINPDSITKRILQNPYFEGASVSRSLPSTLVIAVQERQPVAYLVDVRVYMVDRTGIILRKKPGMSLANYPLITGLSVRELLQDRKPLKDALKLLSRIQEVDSQILDFVSEVHIDRKKAPCLYLIRGGALVELGFENTYRKIFLLSEFFKKSPILNQLDQIKKIDLTFSDRIVVTRKS